MSINNIKKLFSISLISLIATTAGAATYDAEIACFHQVAKFYHCFSNQGESCGDDLAPLTERNITVFHRHTADGQPRLLVFTSTDAYEQAFPASQGGGDSDAPYTEAQFQLKLPAARSPASDQPIYFRYMVVKPDETQARKPAQISVREGFATTEFAGPNSELKASTQTIGDQPLGEEQARGYFHHELARRLDWVSHDYASWDQPTRKLMKARFPAVRAAAETCQKVGDHQVQASAKAALAWIKRH